MRYKGNRDILVKYPDARRHMEFMTYDFTPDSAKTSAVRVVQDLLNSARPTSLTTFGYVDGDQLTKSSRKWPKVVFAFDFIMRNIFGFPRVLAVKLGTKFSNFPASKGIEYRLICWWRDYYKELGVRNQCWRQSIYQRHCGTGMAAVQLHANTYVLRY